MSHKSGIDFATLLASSAHDMKNSLALIVATLDEVSEQADRGCDSHQLGEPLHQLRYEAKRISNDLITLLTLYKLENERIVPRRDLHSVYDFLDDQLLYHQASLNYAKVQTSVDCDELLEWVFDRDLIGGVLNNVINNALRYTQQQVKLSASVADKQLWIRIEDDGPGYPPAMLNTPQINNNVDFKSGSTGLGLYFCHTIAEAHKKGEEAGHIELDNNSSLGGSRFSLFIP